MRGPCLTKLVVVSALVALACSGDETRLPTQPLASTASTLSCNATRINELIDALFPAGTPRTAAHDKFAALQDKMARGKTADARKKMFDLIKTTLAALKAGKLLVPRSSIAPSTQAAVSELISWQYPCVGLPQPGDLTSALDPAGTGGAAVIGPSDPATDVTTGDGQAGVSIPTGAISTTQTVLVTVTRAADQTNPLPTTLPQYGPFYEFHTYPEVTTFAHRVTIGICATVPQAMAGRIQLARPDAATPTTAIEILARGPAATFLACSPLPVAGLRADAEPLARAGRPGLVDRLLAAATGWLRPTPLHAAGLQLDVTGGITARPDNFGDPPTGPIDPESKLVFTTQPSTTGAGQRITPPVTVAVQSGTGQTIPSYTGQITVTFGTNPTGATLSGSGTLVEGVATFDFSIDQPGTAYTLVATASGTDPTPAPATSDPFDITAAYVLIDLGGLGGENDNNAVNVAYDINNAGQIVGTSRESGGRQHGFLWQNGQMTDLGGLAALSAGYALGINSTGQVVGFSSTAGFGPDHAFLWHNGQMTDLGTLPGLDYSVATAINDAGQVVGFSYSVAGDVVSNSAWIWEDGQLTEIVGNSQNCVCDIPSAINNLGQVVGTYVTASGAIHAFLWQNGTMTDLGTLGVGYDASAASGINDAGQIVGVSSGPGAVEDGPRRTRAFLWQGGTMADLGTLGGSFAGANAINKLGQVVGSSTAFSGDPQEPDGKMHAFLWENGRMTALPDPSAFTGTIRISAINDNGDVVGGIGFGGGHAVLWRRVQ